MQVTGLYATAARGLTNRQEVGSTQFICPPEPASAKFRTDFLITSRRSFSDVDNRSPRFAQKMEGVKPCAQFSVSSPAPCM